MCIMLLLQMWACIFVPPLLYAVIHYKEDERQHLNKQEANIKVRLLASGVLTFGFAGQGTGNLVGTTH